MMETEKSFRKSRGQYFTPPGIAQMACEVLALWSGRRPRRALRVVDPACGPGIFLQAAAASLGPQAELVGVDIDPAFAREWASAASVGPSITLGVWNGLHDAPHLGFTPGTFDFVVGNPPFGGAGLRPIIESLAVPSRPGSETPRHTRPPNPAPQAGLSPDPRQVICGILLGVESWRPPTLDAASLAREARLYLSGEPPGRGLASALSRLKRYPIEALFLERFVRLAKPGGWIAVVVPEGLLANERHGMLRQWVAAHTGIRAIVRLPGRTFARSGAAASTSLLILQRKGPGVQAWPSVFLASPDYARGPESEDMDYREAVRRSVAGKLPVPPVVIAVRPDELGTARWHTGYFNPHLSLPSPERIRFPLRPLGEFIDVITYGPIVTGPHARNAAGGTVRVIGQPSLLETGIDYGQTRGVPAESVHDPERSRPREGDLLLPRSGVGTLGRNRMAVFLGEHRSNVGCFVDLLRLKGINPFYLWLFLKTDYGFDQICRLFNGVGTVNLSFGEIRSILVPVAPVDAQRTIEQRYRQEVLPLHQAACQLRHPASRRRAFAQASSAFRILVAAVREMVSFPSSP